MQHAFAALGNVAAAIGGSDAEYTPEDFRGLAKAFVDALDALPVLRALTRIIRFAGGLGNAVEAVRKFSAGQRARKERLSRQQTGGIPPQTAGAAAPAGERAAHGG